MAEDRTDEKRSLARIAQWAVANAISQKFQLENAMIERQFGKQIEMVPFGNQTIVNNQGGSGAGLLGKAALASALALGTGAGGLGLAHLAGLLGGQAAAVAPELPGPEELPLIFEYEFTTDAGRDEPAE